MKFVYDRADRERESACRRKSESDGGGTHNKMFR